MSILSDLGKLVTNASATADSLQAQATDAQEQLTLAFATIIGGEVIVIAELFIIAVILWKNLRK